MGSHERLVRAATRVTELATTRRFRLAAQLVLAAAFIFVLVRLRSAWHDSHVDLARVEWVALAGAFLLSAAGVAAGGFIWLAILRRLGVKTQRRWAGLFFQAQLGKYVPGTVWQYAGRTALSSAVGIPVRAVALSLPIELFAVGLAAAAMAPLLLGWWGVVVVVGLVGAVAAAERRSWTSARPLVNAGTRAWLYYVCAWPLIGLGFWLCARSLAAARAFEIPAYVGAYGVAWLAGLVAIYAPGGIGVREAVLVALLRGRLGTADALVIATVSRALLTLVDLGLAGASFLWVSQAPAAAVPNADVRHSTESGAPSSP